MRSDAEWAEAVLDAFRAGFAAGQTEAPGDVEFALQDWQESQDEPAPVPNTKAQNIAFRKDWDARYEEGKSAG